MRFKQRPRAKRELLFIEKGNKLQRIWRNPPEWTLDDVKQWPDDKLNDAIKETVGQIRFERGWRLMSVVAAVAGAWLVVHALA